MIEKIESERSNSQRLLPLHQALYLWRTPIGTYGYGDAALRIKLKPDAHFVPVVIGGPSTDFSAIKGDPRSCENLDKVFGRIERAVYVVRLADYFDQWNMDRAPYHEYILCSDEAIASWSYDTPEFLEEMSRERDWIRDHQTNYRRVPLHDAFASHVSLPDYVSAIFVLYVDYDAPQRNRPSWLDDTSYPENFDGHLWSARELENRFERLGTSLQRSDGIIHFAKDVRAERKRHFETRWPGYFNARESITSAE